MLMKASTETLRNQNRALVLATLRQLGPVSHTEIAEWTGLGSATVSAITAELETEGVLLRQEQNPPSGRGRPRVLFCQNPASAYVAAIRITFQSVEYSLVDYAGTLKDRFEIARPAADNNIEIFAESFKSGLQRLIDRADLRPDLIRTISITSKGLVARGRPVLLWSPVFEDQKIDFEALLRPVWKAKITLTNDTKFAAQSAAQEFQKNNRQFKTRQFATLALDHSIGLGVATTDATGKINSFSPPFGHMVHQSGGPLCRCGSYGCIEAYAGFYGILRTAFGVKDDTIPAKFIPIGEMEKVAAQARAGDQLAQYAFKQAGEVLGMGLSRLHSFLGTMPIMVIGPGLKFFDLMRDEFEKNIKSNLQVRFDEAVQITTNENEPILIYQGNIQASLADLDANIISDKQMTRRALDNE